MADNTDGTLSKFNFRPGLFRNSTQYSAEGTWWDCDKVRFDQGIPEKMGGWQSITGVSINGTAREILPYYDNNTKKRVAIGTECYLYVEDGGTLRDVTPINVSASVTGVNTLLNSPYVRISLSAHGTTIGSRALVSLATTIGGNILLGGEYFVVSIPDANTFWIDVSLSAAATSTSTGPAKVEVLLPCGNSIDEAVFGYGIGLWNSGTWNTARAGGVTRDSRMRQWSISNYGEDLIANPRFGPLYYVDTSEIASGNRAFLISAAPSICNYSFVSQADRHVVALGCVDSLGTYDPMLVRWSDIEDYTDWTEIETNEAGSIRLSGGSTLVAAVQSKLATLIFSDKNAYAMTFIGPPYVFGFTPLADNCGLVAPHAAVDANGVVFWMSQNAFFKYDGSVSQVLCPLHDDIFSDSSSLVYNWDQKDMIYAGFNNQFNEVIWLYPSGSSQEIDRYLIYNITQDIWYHGTFDRTTWKDFSPYPYATSKEGGKLYEHELGVDDDGGAMDSWIESGFFDLEEGDTLMFIDKIVPDFDLTGTVYLTLYFRKYPNSSEVVTKGPYTINTSTAKISMRARGRTASLRIGASAASDKWRLGQLRMQVREDGGQ